MTSKKGNQKTTTDSLPALRIGSRVRCSDDGVEGRITWANGVAVKIQWDDGEQITWRRDSLTERPVEMLDRSDEESQPGTSAAAAEEEQAIPVEPPPAEPALVPPVAEAAPTAPMPSDTEPAQERTAPLLADGPVENPVKPKRQRKEPTNPKEKKLSALDAAAKVLAEEGKPMSCQELIAAMAARDYWTSPNGRTPAGTLYSAVLREITTKGSNSRFVKAERGKFALANAV